jgi:ribonuclease-3
MSILCDEALHPADVIPYILNEKNQLISEEYVLKLIAKYGVKGVKKINDMNLFVMSMTHSSYLLRNEDYQPSKPKKKPHVVNYSDIEPVKNISNVVPLQPQSYQRLETLGDGVFHLAAIDYLYIRYPTANEGDLSKMRAMIENKQSFAKLCGKIGLNKYVLVSKRMEMYDSRNQNISIMEDCFEAFLGALRLNIGIEKSIDFCKGIIEKEIDMTELLKHNTNYKDTLLQHYHAKKWLEPQYGTVKESGMDHQKEYTMYVTDGYGKRFTTGIGNSKKAGEQEAAKYALLKLGVIKPEDILDSKEITSSESDDDLNYDSEDDSELSQEDLEEMYEKYRGLKT